MKPPMMVLNEQRPYKPGGKKAIVKPLIGGQDLGRFEKLRRQRALEGLLALSFPGKHFDVHDVKVFVDYQGPGRQSGALQWLSCRRAYMVVVR